MTEADDRHPAVFFRPYHCFSYERQWWGGASLPVAFVTGLSTLLLLLTPARRGTRLTTDQEIDMANPANKLNTQQDVSLDAPYGKFQVGSGLHLVDHVSMRAGQLSAMLDLIHGEGHEYFTNLDEKSRQSYLWLAHQLSQELQEALPFITIRAGAVA